MRPPFVPPELVGRPFRRSQGLAAGLSARQLQGPHWRRVFRDVYVHASVEDTFALRVGAVQLLVPKRAVVAGVTAAWLHGADLRPLGPRHVDIAVPPGRAITPAGVRVRQLGLAEGDIVTIRGVAVTSPVRTTFDLACVPRVVDGLVAIDAMANRGGCDLDDLAAYAAAHRGARWIRTLDVALTYADAGSESPQETGLRWQFLEGGLPRPETQVKVHDEFGRLVAALDVGWSRWKVGADYDGEVHAERWAADVRRQETVRDLGWWQRRFVAADMCTPALNVAIVRGALVRAGWRP